MEWAVLGGAFLAPCALILLGCVQDSTLLGLHAAMNALAFLICTPRYQCHCIAQSAANALTSSCSSAWYLMLLRKTVADHETRWVV